MFAMELLDHKALRDHKVRKVRRVHKDLKAHKAHKVLRVQQGRGTIQLLVPLLSLLVLTVLMGELK
jgi:hypothetical protein